MMFFLKLLFFASTFYFTLARPDDSWNPSNPINPPTAPAGNNTNQNAWEQNLQNFISAVIINIDQYLTPCMSSLDSQNQKEFKNLIINGMAGFVNDMFLQIQDSKFKGSLGPGEKTSLNNNDIVIEYQVVWPPGSPFIPEISS